MTAVPTLKNYIKLTCSLSRRIAMSQRMVANDPVIDRFGPRSTPISRAPVTLSGPCACRTIALEMSPAARLLIAA